MGRLASIVSNIASLDTEAMDRAQARLDSLTKPLGSLGRLESLAKQICGITAKTNPSLTNKIIFTLAADHGVTQEGVSAFPKEVTAQMVYNFIKGGAAINVLANHINAKVVVVDIGVCCDLKPDRNLAIKKVACGTKNMADGPAMSREQALEAIDAGFEVFDSEFDRGVDIIGTGEMGIGNTTAASCITAVFTKKTPQEVTGRGAGLDNKALEHKVEVVKKALRLNDPDPADPLGVLSKVGGLEIAGLVGIILAAAAKRVPVVIDGFISGAAALVACRMAPKVKDFMIAAHVSAEGGHRYALDHMGLKPLLDLDMRLGEGTGAALAIGLCEAALNLLTQMATFENAKVSKRRPG